MIFSIPDFSTGVMFSDNICNNLKVLNMKILKAYLKYGKITGADPQKVLTQKVNRGVSRYADHETN